MQAPKRLVVKLFAKNSEVAETEAFVPVFQRWIQEDFADELLIDVVDYKHVPEGPGIILIGYEGDTAYDFVHGKAGLQYTYKQTNESSLVDALTIAVKRLLVAVEKAEREIALNGLEIDATRLQIGFLDRLNYPQDDAVVEAVLENLAPVAQTLFGESASIMVEQIDSREPLQITIQGDRSLSVETLTKTSATA